MKPVYFTPISGQLEESTAAIIGSELADPGERGETALTVPNGWEDLPERP